MVKSGNQIGDHRPVTIWCGLSLNDDHWLFGPLLGITWKETGPEISRLGSRDIRIQKG